MIRTGLYARESTPYQKEKETILTQLQMAETYAPAHGLTIVDTYPDDGVTGTIPFALRPEGKRLLDDVKAGRLDAVLVYKLDRFGRETLEQLLAMREIENAGVRIVSMTENVDKTPAGKFMRTVMAGASQYERDVIVERSVDAQRRLAAEGVWMGGIVPYGYTVVGEDKAARLSVDEEPIPGHSLSPAEVVRRMYHWLADEGRTCVWIADRLTTLGVPPKYVQEGRKVRKGTRTAATSGIWRPSRIRNLVVNSTYKGIHVYGKSGGVVGQISREVAAIVDAETWERAQVTLRNNQTFANRNAKRPYLLRALIKCGQCGLTYSGTHDKRTGRTYYRCNGRTGYRGIYGLNGQRCPNEHVVDLEERVWADIESFLRNPGTILAELASQQVTGAAAGDALRDDIAVIERELAAKTAERDRVISVFTKGFITEDDLTRQLSAIADEEVKLHATVAALRDSEATLARQRASLRTAETMLDDLRTRLDQPLTFDVRRKVVEALVDSVIVDEGRRVRVRYRFSPIVTLTDTDSSQPRG